MFFPNLPEYPTSPLFELSDADFFHIRAPFSM